MSPTIDPSLSKWVEENLDIHVGKTFAEIKAETGRPGQVLDPKLEAACDAGLAFYICDNYEQHFYRSIGAESCHEIMKLA